ncbi:MAG: VOC family protein [Pseudomonadota bacterium]|uniref:Putative enzyme related to lactoylglutathione lyase n=1 Tax=Gallaecimonas pentaromativorans TaxID=584787 RepID=A0A3N1P0K6_9GAMM|nr:VOC family protein [Gallaecimonas pentaromativorans]MED5525688.1 VOC family protein [Pseudomonadota bacterium]ROQ21913.1 putative enzyme related to lactoylglutathione lyase [Gallaecimonas pentaromativorans]
MNLNQVTLPVHDLALANRFYLDLGFTQIVDSPHYARFACPQGEASFSLIEQSAPCTNSAVIYFECEDLDAQVARLKAKGIAFEQEPQDQPYLWREAVLKDPAGNKIKLFWAGQNRLNPPWRVNIQGVQQPAAGKERS